MTTSTDARVEDAVSATSPTPFRLALLVRLHLVATAAPLLAKPLWENFLGLSPLGAIPGAELLYYSAASSVAHAQVLLLAFWGAFGGNATIRRFAGILAGCLYVAFWSTATVWLSQRGMLSLMDVVQAYFGLVLYYLIEALLLTGALLVIRRWYWQLRRIPDCATTVSPGPIRYSIYHLLVGTTILAVVFGLMRFASSASPDNRMVGHFIAQAMVLVSIRLLQVGGSAWAALGPGQVGWRSFLVAAAVLLVHIAHASFYSNPQYRWQDLAIGATYALLPVAIVIPSLLVVRSCGYRLVRRDKDVRMAIQ